MTERVVITSQIPEIALDILRGFDVTVHQSRRARSEDELVDLVRDCDALITLVSDPVSRRVLEAGSRLRIIANYAVGTNNIDLEAAASLGMIVTNTPDVLTSATADLTMALILAVTRRLIEGDRMMREARFEGWHPMLLLGCGLEGKTLGIIGPGRIGRAVARRAAGFDMKVIVSGRAQTLQPPSFSEASPISLEDLLSSSDIVSIHTPLTPETRRLIDRHRLTLMKKGAFLINTARGEIVDEAALADCLDAGHLAGAGLDVFENEPDVSPRLAAMSNVVLLPHIGSATREARTAMAKIAASEVAAVLGGEAPRFPVGSPRKKGER